MRKAKKIVIVSLMILSNILTFSATIEGERRDNVRVVPVSPTPEPSNIRIHFVYPCENEVETKAPVKLQLRLEGYPLGFFSNFSRSREIKDSKQGQALHIIVDGNPYLSVNEAINEVSESEEIDFDQTIEIKIPYTLLDGAHVLRVFPVRSFNESLKGPSCFASTSFFFNTKGTKPPADLSKPYLTYNQPEGEYSGDEPILLDFYLSNTQLSKDGYKVRVTIDNTVKRILTDWVPYYIYGLKKGSHLVKIELLNPKDTVLPPLFNDLQKTILIK